MIIYSNTLLMPIVARLNFDFEQPDFTFDPTNVIVYKKFTISTQ